MKLNYKKTLLVGLVFFYISLFWQIYDNIIPKILEDVFKLSNTKRGIIMAMDNVVALFMLPLFGKLSDKTNTKWGKRTPYIVCGTILAALTFILVAVAGQNASLVFFMFVLGFTLIFMSIFRSPAVALMPDVTVKPLRSKANAIINLMGALGGLISLGLIAVIFNSALNVLPLFAIISGIMLISLVIFLLTVKENKLVEEMKREEIDFNLIENNETDITNSAPNEAPKEKLSKPEFKSMCFLLASVFFWFMAYNAVTSSFSVYAEKVWNITGGSFSIPLMVAQVAAIAMFVPVGIIASKIGRKKTILFGILGMFVAFLLAFVLGSNLFGIKIDMADSVFGDPMFYVMALLFMLCGAGWATINVNSYPMVVEMSKGGSVGAFTGYYYTASMAAQIITPILSGKFMDIFSMKVLFLYSTIFIALAFVTMMLVKHGDSKPLTKATILENFDSAD